MVEKDTIQSMLMYELAKSELPFVSKQDTSSDKIAVLELKLLDETMTAEDEMLTETELLTPEEAKYKRIDILI